MNIYSVNLNLLVYLEALLEEHSVSRAARRVGITQPAMSNALGRLRDLFEDPLFRRTARGIVPTPRAIQLSGSVRKALVEVRGLLGGQPAFDPATAMRTFRLAMTDYAELVLLGKLAQQLRRQAPGVQILVRRPERIFIPPEQELGTGAIDAAIGFYPDTTALEVSTHAMDLFEESNVCIARRGNPFVRKKWNTATFASAPQGGVFYRAESRGLVDNLLTAKGLRRQLVVTTPHFLS
ncbi:MAG TPA: LysR family transcriptional regulator, partial [Acidobacteriota bacterium]